MLNRLADRVRLRASAVASVAPMRAVSSITPRELLVGEEVRAKVDSAEQGGLYRVLVENQPYLLRLPFNAKAGDTILLTVTARDPTLKFEMSEYPETVAQVTRLSDAARFITALLAESEKLPVAATAVAGTPLLAEPPANAATLAIALGNALAESGIFYESHQAQWIAGARSFALLSHEPQALLPPSTEAAGFTVHSSSGNTNVAAGSPELPVHRDALAIVRQQLETLDTGHVMWQGRVWDDQVLEWHITEHKQQWQTHIELALPRLGGVSATLLIEKQSATIIIHAASPDTASLLATHRATLRKSLIDAGVNSLGITIDTDEIH
jgi:hypothetical protein